ncbi:Transglutaminase-like domain-containing protein [Pseudarcicella hirudinis]|uniref:Transglutaminase-like domain-containing protein n=1 Tax=Pseudarcicella hirudinis TaxID=1079859 RepID=A0A1I5RX00_9BACT|nr:transglutaminase-like domain-containing protein [Pseudarcicella hirudinis]SFP63062.1 Transglutaminase-like domain-containing protein [Pseudarcicella hirudinis]
MKHYFQKPKASDLIEMPSFDKLRTFSRICGVIPKAASQAEKLSEQFKGKPLRTTLFSVYKFCRENINYREDAQGIEQIRLPSQTWYDRKRGVDCEDFAIFCSAILINLKIPHRVCMVDYGNGWQHVLILIPSKNCNYILDPVNPGFNKLKAYKRIKYQSF